MLICLNIVVASALDAFQENAESLQTVQLGEEGPSLAPLSADDATLSGGSLDQPSNGGSRSFGRAASTSIHFDANMISGTRTGLESEEWRATVPDSLHQRDTLKRLLRAQAAQTAADTSA